MEFTFNPNYACVFCSVRTIRAMKRIISTVLLFQSNKETERKSLIRRPVDLFFVIYLILAFLFCLFRGLVRNHRQNNELNHCIYVLMVFNFILDCSGLFQ